MTQQFFSLGNSPSCVLGQNHKHFHSKTIKSRNSEPNLHQQENGYEHFGNLSNRIIHSYQYVGSKAIYVNIETAQNLW